MSQSKLQNKEIISFLKGTRFSAGLFDTLKIRYRTYICPFIDLIEKIQPGDRVGDVGCGSGQFLLLVSRFGNQPSSLFGIEITQRLIDNARALFSTVPSIKSTFKTFDGSHFPEELAEMDIVFLVDVVHHVPVQQQENFIANLCRLMKPGSRLVLKDINASSPLVYFNKMHDMIFAGEMGHELKMEKAKTLLEQNGMEIIEQKKQRMYVYPHYTLVARKK